MKHPLKNFEQLKGYENMEVSTQILIKEALACGYEVEIISAEHFFIQLKKDGKVFPVIESTICHASTLFNHWICENKHLTKLMLERYHFSYPKGVVLHQIAEHNDALAELSYPLVVKPSDTNFGKGITLNINNKKVLTKAVTSAFTFSDKVIVEEYVGGQEYRFLVIGGKLQGIVRRDPAHVVGDGQSPIKLLIEKKNYGRATTYITPVLQIKIDANLIQKLASQHLTLESIPEMDEKIELRDVSNVSLGGDCIDVTDDIPHFYKQEAERVATALQTPIVGVDMIIKDETATPSIMNYAIIEINERPALAMHNFPFIGKNRDVGKAILDVITGRDNKKICC